ncbi:hypothetical protein C8Q77DRAFT_1162438 [Trametes polyzona]|nr:hypothetical protein C8Q77DRAFT_1162438 [Trametes polyzona]
MPAPHLKLCYTAPIDFFVALRKTPGGPNAVDGKEMAVRASQVYIVEGTNGPWMSLSLCLFDPQSDHGIFLTCHELTAVEDVRQDCDVSLGESEHTE